MTITLPGLVFLVVIAAICGAVGRAIAGEFRGGLILSIAMASSEPSSGRDSPSR